MCSQAHYCNQSVFAPHQSQNNPDGRACSTLPASSEPGSSSSVTNVIRTFTEDETRHLETPPVTGEGQLVAPEGCDLAETVTELPVIADV